MRISLILVIVCLLVICSSAISTPKKKPQLNFDLDCITCKFFLDLLGNLVDDGTTVKDAELIMFPVCADLLKVEDDKVCRGILNEFVPLLFDVIKVGAHLDSGLVCGDFGFCPVYPMPYVWNPVFPKPKPPYVPPHVIPGQNYYILHLSDIHFDPKYTVGAPTNCGEPLCCRKSDNGTGSAQKWGDYMCDLNPDLLNWSMNYFNSSLPVKPKFVVMTGDLPPHNVWNQTETTNLDFSMFISKTLMQTFDKLNIPVYPAIGNHEGSPVNNFPVNQTSWLYAPLAQVYSKWLSSDAQQTFSANGFYTQVVEPGLRIVSLNDNFCNNGNLWIYLNQTDPANMLEWTIRTLQTAEDNKEKVFVLAHIPTGIKDCVAAWGSSFYKIVNRYENTISAMFMGHTHEDHFQVFYENGTESRATAVTYIAPSLTTFTNKNPSYRLYTVDQKTHYIVESDTYHVNITSANLYGPSFVHEYSATKAYNMSSLFPQDWANLAERFKKDDALFQNWYYYKLTGTCDDCKCTNKCKKENICSVQSGSYGFYKECLAASAN